MKSPTPASAPQASPRRRPPSRADAPPRGVTLTQPQHVRDIAAQLFNQSLKRWSRQASVTDARALLALLTLTREAIADVLVEARIARMEAELAKLDAQDAAP